MTTPTTAPECAIDGTPITADTPAAFYPLTDDDRKLYAEPARRMAAAMLSCHLGNGLEYTYKTYCKDCKDEEVGERWLWLARFAHSLGA